MKRILIGATLVVAGIIGVAGASPVSAANANTGACQPQTSHIPASTTSVTVTAPDGKLISGYCVKAGSANQGLGPEYKYFNPPVSSVTITHPSGKNISHYIVFYTNVEDEGPVQVTPAKPDSPDPTCEAAGTVEVLTDTNAYSYNYNTADGVTTVTVTAKEGYFLVGDTGPWTYTIAPQLTGEACEDDPVVESNPPAAVVPPAAPTDRPPVLTDSAVASAGPAPAQAAPTALPATGTSSWVLAFIAMGLVLLGSGFVGFSRRLS